MDRLRERLNLASRALDRLAEVSHLAAPLDLERDAAIQRFEYTFEAVWKATQRYLHLIEGVRVGSPKACLRAAADAGLLEADATERALAMVDYRNLTVHTYNEEVARAIYERLEGHTRLLDLLLSSMKGIVETKDR